MASSIDGMKRRFEEIIKGRIRKDLKGYIQRGELIGKRGKDLISVPVPQIVLPRFIFGRGGRGGVASGEGGPGKILKPGQGKDKDGVAGDQPGGHIIEVDVTLDELAEMLGDELGLPPPDPKGQHQIEEKKDRYTSARRTGPEGLLFKKRSMKEALRRLMADIPLEILKTKNFKLRPFLKRFYPVRPDKIYRSWKTYPIKVANAVIVFMMDVSGSMMDEQKEIVRQTCFWLELWIRHEYLGIDTRYIVHDSEAAEVDSNTFYHTRESGGTIISSAYRLADIMTDGSGRYESRFGRNINPGETSIYYFHFSDGDNWGEDNAVALDIVESKLLPRSKLFAYFQVESPYGSGAFMNKLKQVKDQDHLALATIPNKEGIYEALKVALPKERRV